MLTELLKLQTRAQHRAMEESNPVPNSRDEYVGRLIAFFGFVAPWEERVAMALPETDPIRLGRAKTRWLEEDLEVFGYDSEQRRRLPRTNSLPSTSSRNHILGASYVLEGSTLGGQMITRHISRMLGLSGTHGCRFFSSYGTHVGSQ